MQQYLRESLNVERFLGRNLTSFLPAALIVCTSKRLRQQQRGLFSAERKIESVYWNWRIVRRSWEGGEKLALFKGLVLGGERCFCSVERGVRIEERVPSMQSVRIKCRGDIADGLIEALMCFGASSCSIEDANHGALHEEEIFSDGPVAWQGGHRQLWHQSRITALFPEDEDVGECLALASNSIGLLEMPYYEVAIIEDYDWIDQLQRMFEPVEVASGLWIVPKWRLPPNPRAVNVILDPGLAFGTGEHPTTRLCLRWLNRVIEGGECILDYGIGSGILAIAALKMGASQAVGVDIDPMAISSAKHNAALNNLEDYRLKVYLSSMGGEDPVPLGAACSQILRGCNRAERRSAGRSEFDVVVANILMNPLIGLTSRIISYARTGGFVALSGILATQVDQVRQAYSPHLESIQVTYDGDWSCINGIKKI